jgi:hypothetical protein
MKPFLLIASLLILLSCQKSNITVQTWKVKTGSEKNPANSFCTWYGDSTVRVVFNSKSNDNLQGTVYVYRVTKDSTFYWQYLKLLK